MTTERKPLDFGDLDDFEPRPPREKSSTPKPSVAKKAVDQVTAFPSRESSEEGQLNIRAPEAVIHRFRGMAKAERYKLGAFLEVLLDSYEERR